MISDCLKLIAQSLALAAGLAATATAVHWLPIIRPNAWPMAAGLYVLIIAATLATGFTLKDTFNRIKKGIEG